MVLVGIDMGMNRYFFESFLYYFVFSAIWCFNIQTAVFATSYMQPLAKSWSAPLDVVNKQAIYSHIHNLFDKFESFFGVGFAVISGTPANNTFEHDNESLQGFYELSTTGTTTTYTITATHKGAQANDTNCKTMSFDQDNNRTSTDATDAASTGCF